MQTLSALSLLIALLLGGLPLGMPPAAEDPLLSAVAPESCFLYVSWAGVAAPRPESPNRTERLLAEPDVQRLVDELQKRLKAALKRGAGKGERNGIVADEFPTVLRLLVTRPAALSVEGVPTPQKPGSFPAQMTLTLHVGDQAKTIENSFLALEQAFGMESFVVAGDDVAGGGMNWHVLPTTPQFGFDIRWGLTDNGYLLIANEQKTASRLLARLRNGKPPEWLTAIKRRLAVERVALVTHVDLQQLLPLLPLPWGGAEALELSRLQSLDCVQGLDETGCVSRTWLKMDGRPAALLKLLDVQPLDAAALQPIPDQATLALAARIDLARTARESVALMEKHTPGSGLEFAKEFEDSFGDLGFSVQKDLLPALGDTWRIYHAPAEEGTLFTSWTAVASLRDPQKLKQISNSLVAKPGADAAESRRTNSDFAKNKQFSYQNREISVLNSVGDASPISPAWCVTENELIVSTFPQGVQTYLSRDRTKQSLADQPDVAAALKGPNAPLLYIHYNSAELCREVYPLAKVWANLSLFDLQQRGVDIDISLLPALPSLVKHLGPGSTAVHAVDDGLIVTNRATIPLGIGPFSTLLAILLGENFP